jgi:hypothetical protein
MTIGRGMRGVSNSAHRSSLPKTIMSLSTSSSPALKSEPKANPTQDLFNAHGPTVGSGA